MPARELKQTNNKCQFRQIRKEKVDSAKKELLPAKEAKKAKKEQKREIKEAKKEQMLEAIKNSRSIELWTQGVRIERLRGYTVNAPSSSKPVTLEDIQRQFALSRSQERVGKEQVRYRNTVEEDEVEEYLRWLQLTKAEKDAEKAAEWAEFAASFQVEELYFASFWDLN